MKASAAVALAAVVTLAGAGRGAPQERRSFRIAEQYLLGEGDEWRFKNLVPGGRPAVGLKVGARLEFRGAQVARRDEDNGDYRYESLDPGRGLSLHRIYSAAADRTTDYERPVVLFPEAMELGRPYRSEVRYEQAAKGRPEEWGTQTYEATAEAVESVDTLLGRFEGCLVIRTVSRRRADSGGERSYDLREWYKAGVGPVKAKGQVLTKNAQGETVRAFTIDSVLEHAVVAGRVLAPERGGRAPGSEAALNVRWGRPSYRKKSTGTEHGRDHFWLTKNRDGSRALRCLTTTDRSEVVRDVTYTVSAEGRPLGVDGLDNLLVRYRWGDLDLEHVLDSVSELR